MERAHAEEYARQPQDLDEIAAWESREDYWLLSIVSGPMGVSS